MTNRERDNGLREKRGVEGTTKEGCDLQVWAPLFFCCFCSIIRSAIIVSCFPPVRVRIMG